MEFLEAKKMTEQQLEETCIPGDALVKVIQQGDIVEVKWSSNYIHLGCDSNVKRIDKEHYMVRATGEVKEYKHNTANIDGIEKTIKMQKSLQRTFYNLRALINTNFRVSDIIEKKVLFVTLTYAEQVEGAAGNDRLYNDFKMFIRGLNKQYKDFGKVEYINVIEPQGSGRWHIHCLLKWPGVAPFVPFDILNSLWPWGYTKVNLVGAQAKEAKSIDNLGAYLTAYLVDLPLEDVAVEQREQVENQCRDSIVEKNGKKYIKGGRLWMYPEGMKIYRTSRGLQRPQESVTGYCKVVEDLGDCMTYKAGKEIFFFEDIPGIDIPEPLKKEMTPQTLAESEGHRQVSSVIHLRQYYNTNRKKSQ